MFLILLPAPPNTDKSPYRGFNNNLVYCSHGGMIEEADS